MALTVTCDRPGCTARAEVGVGGGFVVNLGPAGALQVQLPDGWVRHGVDYVHRCPAHAGTWRPR